MSPLFVIGSHSEKHQFSRALGDGRFFGCHLKLDEFQIISEIFPKSIKLHPSFFGAKACQSHEQSDPKPSQLEVGPNLSPAAEQQTSSDLPGSSWPGGDIIHQKLG